MATTAGHCLKIGPYRKMKNKFGGQAVGYDFEGESSMDHPCNAWFILVNGFQMNERFSNGFFFFY
jgi:hypothetical protein